MACELGKFNLENALKIGMIPLVLDSSDPEGKLAGYSNLYLEQEVQAEGLTRNIGAFARFLEAMSFSHGAVLNAQHRPRLLCCPPERTYAIKTSYARPQKKAR